MSADIIDITARVTTHQATLAGQLEYDLITLERIGEALEDIALHNPALLAPYENRLSDIRDMVSAAWFAALLRDRRN